MWPGEEVRNVISCTINTNNSKYLGLEHAHYCGVSSLPWLQLEQSHLGPVCLGRAALRNEVTLEKTFLHSWQMDKNIWTSTGLGRRAGARVKHRAQTSGARAAGPQHLATTPLLDQELHRVCHGPHNVLLNLATQSMQVTANDLCPCWKPCFAAQWLTYWVYKSDIRASALPIAVRVSWTVLWDRVHSTTVNQRWAED